MRARVSGSSITAHGDNLALPYVEFYGNEPTGFPTGWTVAGSSPNRVLTDPSGHEFSRELPEQAGPASTGGRSLSATTLSAAITASDVILPLAAPVSGSPVGFLAQIGTELLEARYLGHQTEARRGAYGTTAAAHDSGATVTPVQVVVQTDAPTAPPPATAGAAQTVSLIGPFPFAFDDMGVDETGGTPTAWFDGGFVSLGDIPDGAIVVAMWAEVTSNFLIDGGGVAVIQLAVQPTDDPDDSSDVVRWNGHRDTTATATFATAVQAAAGALITVRAITGAQIMAYRYSSPSGDVTAGAADVYALIATPA